MQLSVWRQDIEGVAHCIMGSLGVLGAGSLLMGSRLKIYSALAALAAGQV